MADFLFAGERIRAETERYWSETERIQIWIWPERSTAPFVLVVLNEKLSKKSINTLIVVLNEISMAVSLQTIFIKISAFSMILDLEKNSWSIPTKIISMQL